MDFCSSHSDLSSRFIKGLLLLPGCPKILKSSPDICFIYPPAFGHPEAESEDFLEKTGNTECVNPVDCPAPNRPRAVITFGAETVSQPSASPARINLLLSTAKPKQHISKEVYLLQREQVERQNT